MATMTIQNPDSKRSVKVRVWSVNTKDVAAKFKAKEYKTARDLSWALLGQKHSVTAMERSDGGDSASNNFALNVLENALDWSLGIAVVNFMRDAASVKRCPRTFQVGASRNGDVFIIVPRKGESVAPWVAKY